jgi:hypothetical protein
VPDESDWQCGWEDARKRQLTAGFDATPAQRLALLEEMILLAHRFRALPRVEGSPVIFCDAPDPKRDGENS